MLITPLTTDPTIRNLCGICQPPYARPTIQFEKHREGRQQMARGFKAHILVVESLTVGEGFETE